MPELTPRLVRVVDFVAELLEEEADRLLAGRDDSRRTMAEILRKSDNPRMVRVWEE